MSLTSRRLAIVTAALVASATILVGGATDAATLGAAGWWWQGNPGGSSLTPSPAPQVTTPGEVAAPAPPDVPEGGLLVERTPERTTAIAAVRFSLAEGESNPVLELVASSTAGTPALLACQSGSAWSESAGGRWDSKPLAACDVASGGGSVAGVAGDGGTWTFNLGALAIDSGAGQVVDVVLVPPASPDPASAAFRVVFEPVTADSLQTQAGTGDVAFDAPDVESAPSFGAGGSGTAGGGSGAGSTFTAPGGPPVVSPDLPAADQGLSATAPAIRNPPLATAPAATATEPDDAGDKVAGVGAVLLAAGAALALTRRPAPAATGLIPPRSARHRALAAAGTPIAARTGGLGRFVRERTRPPVRL